jgi:hypothetical protein
MAMEWSFNESEVHDLAMEALEGWSVQDLAEALAFADCDGYEGDNLEAFEVARTEKYLKLPHDILAAQVYERAYTNYTCSNDFSELYIDKQGYRTIVLPE